MVESPDDYSVPVIKFDEDLVTDNIRADLKSNIENISDVPIEFRKQLYEIALVSVTRGRDLYFISKFLLGVGAGIDKRRAGEIARSLNNKATSLIQRDRQIALGIKHAIWMHSGAPCSAAGNSSLDAAHRAVNGKKFHIEKGMLINGRYTWPAYDDGCKCSSKAAIKGFV